MRPAVINSRVLLISGTSKGIGKYLAEYYLAKGDRVVGCSRGPAVIEHDDYRHFRLDVSDEAEVKQMLMEISRTYQRLDVLINNAGIASMNHILLTPVEVA